MGKQEKNQYEVMALISLIIRNVWLPNPFEASKNGLSIPVGESVIMLPPVIANLVAEPFMYMITRVVVGFYYNGRSPAWGSFLYLFFYAVHTFLLWLVALLEFRWWYVCAILGVYIACHVATNRIIERFRLHNTL